MTSHVPGIVYLDMRPILSVHDATDHDITHPKFVCQMQGSITLSVQCAYLKHLIYRQLSSVHTLPSCLPLRGYFVSSVTSSSSGEQMYGLTAELHMTRVSNMWGQIAIKHTKYQPMCAVRPTAPCTRIPPRKQPIAVLMMNGTCPQPAGGVRRG